MSGPSDSNSAPLDGVVAVMREAHGFDVACYDESLLAASLEKRRAGASCQTDAAYLEFLRRDRAEAAAFFDSLQARASGFFQDPLTYALLERAILPALAEARARSDQGEIRVWSAGCAAGQEAWSVAILLDRLSTTHGRPVPYRVFATDVSGPDLDTARTGVYDAEILGNVRLCQLRDCFSPQGEVFAIAPRIREHVGFSGYDLLEERTSCPPACGYGDFDLVLCCNLLLRYRLEMRRLILEKVRRGLAIGGYLMTGETERQIVESTDGFRAVAPLAALFRKTSRGG